MKFSASINITATPALVWKAISDIKNAGDMVTGINKVEILDKPENGLVGLKWQETRTMFGKEAIETMWITESEENVFYKTNAENCGSLYISELRITPLNENEISLTMMFEGIPQTFMAKVMSAVMMPFFKGSMIKMLKKDLLDIKSFVE